MKLFKNTFAQKRRTISKCERSHREKSVFSITLHPMSETEYESVRLIRALHKYDKKVNMLKLTTMQLTNNAA